MKAPEISAIKYQVFQLIKQYFDITKIVTFKKTENRDFFLS